MAATSPVVMFFLATVASACGSRPPYPTTAQAAGRVEPMTPCVYMEQVNIEVTAYFEPCLAGDPAIVARGWKEAVEKLRERDQRLDRETLAVGLPHLELASMRDRMCAQPEFLVLYNERHVCLADPFCAPLPSCDAIFDNAHRYIDGDDTLETNDPDPERKRARLAMEASQEAEEERREAAREGARERAEAAAELAEAQREEEERRERKRQEKVAARARDLGPQIEAELSSGAPSSVRRRLDGLERDFAGCEASTAEFRRYPEQSKAVYETERAAHEAAPPVEQKVCSPGGIVDSSVIADAARRDMARGTWGTSGSEAELTRSLAGPGCKMVEVPKTKFPTLARWAAARDDRWYLLSEALWLDAQRPGWRRPAFIPKDARLVFECPTREDLRQRAITGEHLDQLRVYEEQLRQEDRKGSP